MSRGQSWELARAGPPVCISLSHPTFAHEQSRLASRFATLGALRRGQNCLFFLFLKKFREILSRCGYDGSDGVDERVVCSKPSYEAFREHFEVVVAAAGIASDATVVGWKCPLGNISQMKNQISHGQ
jgi:hypothetical protein